VGVEPNLADHEPSSGAQHAPELSQRAAAVPNLAENGDEERGVERVAVERQRRRVGVPSVDTLPPARASRAAARWC
jgi:hypothetical protein